MNINSMHNSIIILHAASATLAFLAGCILIFSSAFISNPRLFKLYWWALIGMVILLAAAIVVYWTQYTSIERIIFPGLLILGVYMVFRAWNANRLLDSKQRNWTNQYIDDIGFTLISLFEGFIIVSGLNSGFPVWLIVVTAVTGILIGRWVIGSTQRKVA